MRLFVFAATAVLLTACDLGPVDRPHTLVASDYKARATCVLDQMSASGYDKMGTTYLDDAKNQRATLIFAKPPYVAASYPVLPGESLPYVFRIQLAQNGSDHVLASLDMADQSDKAQAEDAQRMIQACDQDPLPVPVAF